MVLKYYLLISLAFCSAAAIKQHITLYDSNDDSGEGVILSGKYTDLSQACFNRRTNYHCASGMWVLYELPNYDYDGENVVLDGDNECARSNLQNGYQSIRYLGASDTSVVALSLYEQKWASGTEHAFTAVATDGPVFPTGSLAVTGFSNWTLFTDSDYQGATYCVQSTDEYTYIGTWSDQYPSTVGSVLRGCDRKTDYHIKLPSRGAAKARRR